MKNNKSMQVDDIIYITQKGAEIITGVIKLYN